MPAAVANLKPGSPVLRCGTTLVLGLSAVVVLSLLAFLPAAQSGPSPDATRTVVSLSAAASPSATAPTSTALADEKTRQEIDQLRLANRDKRSPWRFVPTLAPWFAALITLLTLLYTWSHQRSADRAERVKDRQLREAEVAKQFDASLTQTVANLGSGSESLKASAAASLMVYVGAAYSAHHEMVSRIVFANLRAAPTSPVRNLLVDVVGKILAETPTDDLKLWRLSLAECPLIGLNASSTHWPDTFHAERADLSHAQLDGVHAWHLMAAEATLRSASLKRANLGPAVLARADLTQVDLSGALLNSADLRSATAQYGAFLGAKLQSVHFDDADLRGARFLGANINDAYFIGAQLDAGALRTLLKAENWRKAHFDDATVLRLEQLRTV